jgi:microcystin-dependent protein
MALQFIITDAGRAAIAQVGGAIGPVTLTKIAIGSGGYTPLATRTALQTEIKRLDPSGSSVPVPGTIHLTAQDDSADSYSVKEIGLYTNNNVLFAIYSQTGVILTKGSTASALFAMDFVMTNVPAGTVVVGDAGFSYAQANETRLGVLAIATTAEAQAGTIDTKIITPLKLAQVTATESRRGVIALATTAEAQALAPDATKALTVARLVDRTANTGRAGVVVLASSTETQTGTDANKAVTPAGLKSTLGGYSASNHTHAIADTTGLQAALDSKTLPARLGGTAQSISNWNDALENGWYQSNQATNAPENVLDWWLGYVEVHNGSWVTQTVHRFTADAPTNTHIWRRSSSDNGGVRAWGGWYKLQLSQGEQDARYSLGTHNHPASVITSGTIDNARLNAATTSVAGIVELATNAETQNGTDTTRAVTPASLASAAALFVPPGAVLPFAMNVVPSGWLAANGAAVSRALYPALFAAIGTLYGVGDGSTTFNVPDLRGYFVRGQGTNSDGTAAGNFGAKQADDFKSHNHTGSTSQNGGHNHTYNSHSATFNLQGGSSGGAVQNIMRNPDGNGQTSTVGNHSHTITAEGGTETRPKNIALLYCIKI